MDHVAISERDVFVLDALGLNADLAGLSPTAPKHAVLHGDLLDRLLVVVDRFDRDRIVKGTDKAVFDGYVVGVYNVDSVGVVSPMSDDLDVINLDVAAPKHGKHPGGGIEENDVGNVDILALVDAEASLGKGCVAVLQEARLVGVVEYAAAEDLDILYPLGKDRAENDRLAVDVDGIVISQIDHTGEMHSGTKIDRCILCLWVFLDGIKKDMKHVVRVAKLKHVAAVIGKGENDLSVAHFCFYVFGKRSDQSAFKALLSLDAKLDCFIRRKRDEACLLALIKVSLKAGPRSVKGNSGNTAGLHLAWQSVDCDIKIGVDCLIGYLCAVGGVLSDPGLCEGDVKAVVARIAHFWYFNHIAFPFHRVWYGYYIKGILHCQVVLENKKEKRADRNLSSFDVQLVLNYLPKYLSKRPWKALP